MLVLPGRGRVADLVDLDVHGVAGDGHLVASALRRLGCLRDVEVVETPSVDAVLLQTLPIDVFRIGLAGLVYEPWNRVVIEEVRRSVISSLYHVNSVVIVAMMCGLKPLEVGLCGCREGIPAVAVVQRAGPEAECNVGAVLGRGVHKRLSSRNRADSCEIVRIE